MSVRNLLDQTLGAAFSRQLALEDFLGERSFTLNLNEGEIKFGEDMSFPIQILGSEAFPNNSWMWAWANARSVPPQLAQASENLRRFGEENQLPIFTSTMVGLDEVSGFELALASSEILGGHPVYRIPTEHYALYLILLGLPAGSLQRPPQLAAGTLTQLLATFVLHPRHATIDFLASQGFEVDDSGPGVAARHASGTEVKVDFDEQGRVALIH